MSKRKTNNTIKSINTIKSVDSIKPTGKPKLQSKKKTQINKPLERDRIYERINKQQVSSKKQEPKPILKESQIILFTQNKKTINKSRLKPGDIVRFTYRGKQHHDDNPLVLILNRDWYGKTHGVALRYLSVRQIQKLAALVMKRRSIYTMFKNVFNLKPDQNITMQNPRSFYYQKLKPFIRSTKTNIYRTYFYSGISNVVHYSFKFQKDIWRQLNVQKQKLAAGYERLSDAEFYKQVVQKGIAQQKIPVQDVPGVQTYNARMAMKQLKKAGLV